MSLDWDAKKVKNWEELQSDDLEWSKTAYLCFELMRCDIGRITTLNYQEVWTRVEMMQQLEGPLLFFKGEPYYYTLEDIKRRIGYWTNVKTLSSVEWFRRIHKLRTERIKREERLQEV